VFDPVSFASNDSVFNGTAPGQLSSIRTMIEMVAEGRSIVMLSYGASGSGKSYLMMENKDSLIYQAIKCLQQTGTIELHAIKEEYVEKFKNEDSKWRLYGRIIDHGKTRTENNVGHQPSFTKGSDLTSTLLSVNKKRTDEGRIKPTVNNDKSSRSHLFVTLKYTGNTGKTGFLTFVDMAGSESPIDMYNSMIRMDEKKIKGSLERLKTPGAKDSPFHSEIRKELMNLEAGTKPYYDTMTKIENNPSLYFIPKRIAEHANASVDNLSTLLTDTTIIAPVNRSYYNDMYIKKLDGMKKRAAIVTNSYMRNIIREGIYINESINEMVYYLATKRNPNINKVKQSNKRLYDMNPRHFFNAGKTTDVQMPGLLKELDELGGQNTKWVLFVNIRLDQKDPHVCGETLESMRFAERISNPSI
jgi:hypothetical protein